MVAKAKPGKAICLKCGKPFSSPDKTRIRRCPPCKENEDPYQPPVFHVSDVRAAMRSNR